MIDFLIIFFVARYFQKSLIQEKDFELWSNKLYQVRNISIGLFVATLFFKEIVYISWIGHACLLYCIYILYTEPFFKSAKTILIALAPYALVATIISLIKIILPQFYKNWDDLIDSIEVFAILWGIGVWMITIKQKKELDKTRKKVEEQEAVNKAISSMKEQLEIQVAERTAELTRQKQELETTLHELKSTQAQLIQSEKMASLGELTAGIAHEIQNPLNFVNNFAELNKELIEELKQERGKENGERDAVMENDILKDIELNLEKINHHGKRADAIVKSMLQHSRQTKGVKELIDINDLCDEYLRLSFHGLRAKDKSFNADFKTDFDEQLSANAAGIGKITVVPQNMGRVLLNLFTNAFYAVNQKAKSSIEGYKPLVTVSTRKLYNSPLGNGAIEIKITDNGNGIPQNIIDKIFQPFFTTKPTGQGTGLGLSLSYDIITKEHNGTISVESPPAAQYGTEGAGAEFTIVLPPENAIF